MYFKVYRQITNILLTCEFDVPRMSAEQADMLLHSMEALSLKWYTQNR